MTSSIFKSTQLKATLLGSFRAMGGRPDPAKSLKAILMCKEQNKEVFLEKNIKVNTKITKKGKIKITNLDNFLLYRIVKVFYFI